MQSFYGEKNYIVTTMQCWKDIQEDYRNGKLDAYIRENYPESSLNYGILVLVPKYLDLKNTNVVHGEFQLPTPLSNDRHWKLWTAIPCREGSRDRSMAGKMYGK